MKPKLLLIVVVSFVMASLMLAGCSGSASSEWKKAFESYGYDYRPSNDYIHESDYSITGFDVKKADGSDSAVWFTAKIENDYFALQVKGTGVEDSKGEKEIKNAELESFTAKKPVDNFADSNNWFDSILEGTEFSMNESKNNCTADIDKDIDLWFGTVHVKDSVNAELSKSGWELHHNVSEANVTKISDAALGTYTLKDAGISGDALVKQFELVLDDAGYPAMVIQQPELTYRELFGGFHIGKLNEWHSAARELNLILSEKDKISISSDSINDKANCKYTVSKLKTSYPAEDNPDWSIDVSAEVVFSSVRENEIEVLPSWKGSSSKTQQTGSIDDMNGSDIELLEEGTYTIQ